jgi:CheY-like chemotaxis protein
MQKKLKILLVEDDPICQKTTEEILKQHYKCKIEVAMNATHALELVYDHALEWDEKGYDVILMDIYLPDINGDSLTEVIRKTEAQTKSVPVIAISGRANKNDKLIFQNMGITDLLLKPVTFEKLHQMLSKYIAIDPYLLT